MSLLALVTVAATFFFTSCYPAYKELEDSKGDLDDLSGDSDDIAVDDDVGSEESDDIVVDDEPEAQSPATLVGVLPQKPDGYYRDGGHKAYTSSSYMNWNGAGDPVLRNMSEIDGKAASIVSMSPFGGGQQVALLQVGGYPGIAAIDDNSGNIVRAEVRVNDTANAVSGIFFATNMNGLLFGANMGTSGGALVHAKDWPSKSLGSHEEICVADVDGTPSAAAVQSGSLMVLVGNEMAKMEATASAICESGAILSPTISLGGKPTINKVLPLGVGSVAVAMGSEVGIVNVASGQVNRVETGALIADIATHGAKLYAVHPDGNLFMADESGEGTMCDTEISGASFVGADSSGVYVLAGSSVYMIDTSACED